MHTVKTHNRPDFVESKEACSARILHQLAMGNKQVENPALWGTVFQRNGFMEMRVKGSIVRPLIGCLWTTDTCTHPHTDTLQQETMLYERGSPFTLITAVTWHAVGCPSVLNIYVSTAVLPWWLSRLWHMLSLFCYLPLSCSTLKFNKNSKTAEKHKGIS